ncbi:hypothetical protein ACHAWO_008286 [Cyclotella atomus]|uniref:Uncharacterized protein n=1 Tax=Cyclotella atomus TaxID=382360 RepID=A0ABD3MWA8_9STRA
MKRSILVSTVVLGASSSIAIDAASIPQHLRGPGALIVPASQIISNKHRALQDENPDSRYCGTNWQTAHDACDAPCPSALDEDCGPGLYCFGFVGCTPPAGSVPDPVPATDPPAPDQPEGPAMPPSEYTPTATGGSEIPAPSPSESMQANSAPNGIPSYIASLPLAPSEPTTPAPFSIPVPAPNLLPNPTSNYCGYGWESANTECYYACPSGKDDECPGGRTCHTWLKCTQAAEDPALYNVCGTTWLDASTKCATRCFMSGDDGCPNGESCFGNVVECKENPNLPELTAEDVGQAPKMYTQEEIDALLEEELTKEAEAAAMEDPDNWWCGTSWSNMLENCSKRCTKDDDCVVNSWETATCFKTPGGPGNCAIPGQPAKQASVPGSKWCGATWNDMLETCAKKCEADEDCDGTTCWEAPGTCQYIGVPVKEVSDPATLWCGTSFDDAAVSCHKACPSESDDECPEGMSCFAGSACTEEGVPVVRENYRCGSSWDDAATKCGVECQKDEDCTVENGAAEGDICYADVECVSAGGAGSSGMMCVSNWEAAQDECPTASTCESDDDCTGGTLCMWIDCLATEEDSDAQAGLSTPPGTTTPGTLPGCSAEVKMCDDGQYVARAPELNCEFYPCPEDSQGNETEAGAMTDGEEGSQGEEGFSDSSEGQDESQNMVTNSEGLNDSTQGEENNDVPEGWDTVPLTFASSKCEGECTVCQGDCNSDADCAEGLKCFSRGKGEVTAVPGCVSGGEGDLPGMDYCYLPEPPTTTTTTTTTTTEEPTTTTTTEAAELMSADMLSFDAPELSFVRECTAEYPCGACEGDCDDDTQCASGLKCFSRIQGSVEFVPGCRGMGIAGMDFCYDPTAPIILPTTTGATTRSPPEEEELVGCSAEVKPCPGSTVLVYRNPAKGCAFDLCPGESSTSTSSSESSTSSASTTGTNENDKSSTTEATSPASTQGTTTPDSSIQVASTEAALVTCDTLCLNELPASFCPTQMDSLPNCLNIDVGHICEGSGECATNDSLNNCQTFDIYVRVECGGDTPTQGYPMANPDSQAPVTTEVPLTTSNGQGDNSQGDGNVTIVSDEHIGFNTGNINSTVAPSVNTSVEVPGPNVTLPEIASPDLLNTTVQTTSSSPVPNATVEENVTEPLSNSNLTLPSEETDIASAAAATFTYDRSPNGESAMGSTNEESFADFAAQDYSDADSWSSSSNSEPINPYTADGWDLTGYFTQSVESSASIYSRNTVMLIAAAFAFAFAVILYI